MKPQAPAILLLTVFLALSAFGQERRAVIRTNQLGYLPALWGRWRRPPGSISPRS